MKRGRNRKPIVVHLSEDERGLLKELLKKGQEKARKLTRARILLLKDEGRKESEIAESLHVDVKTVQNISRRYQKEGCEASLSEKSRSGAPTIFDGKQRAKITALACSKAPDGRSQWSLRLIADKAVELKLVDSISAMEVHRILKKTKLSRT